MALRFFTPKNGGTVNIKLTGSGHKDQSCSTKVVLGWKEVWNKKKKRIEYNGKPVEFKNKHLGEMESFILEKYFQAVKDPKQFIHDGWLKIRRDEFLKIGDYEVNPTERSESYLKDLAERYFATLNDPNRYNYIVKRYIDDNIPLFEVDYTWLENLYSELRASGKSSAYTREIITTIKAVLLYGVRQLRLPIDDSVLQFQGKYRLKKKVAPLTFKQEYIKKLDSVYFSGGGEKEETRKRLLIQIKTGLRASDLNKVVLNPKRYVDVDRMEIRLTMDKTKKEIAIPIDLETVRLINSTDHIVSFDTVTYIRNIKDVCRTLGFYDFVETEVSGQIVKKKFFWEAVGSHTARRTFLTNLYYDGLPVAVIMTLSGHSLESTFRKYIGVDEADVLRDRYREYLENKKKK